METDRFTSDWLDQSQKSCMSIECSVTFELSHDSLYNSMTLFRRSDPRKTMTDVTHILNEDEEGMGRLLINCCHCLFVRFIDHISARNHVSIEVLGIGSNNLK